MSVGRGNTLLQSKTQCKIWKLGCRIQQPQIGKICLISNSIHPYWVVSGQRILTYLNSDKQFKRKMSFLLFQPTFTMISICLKSFLLINLRILFKKLTLAILNLVTPTIMKPMVLMLPNALLCSWKNVNSRNI